MTGSYAAFAASPQLVNPSFAAQAVSSTIGIGGSNTARLRLNSDGTTQAITTAGGTVSRTAWAANPAAGIGNSVWVRYTVTGGTATSNGASAFTQISTNIDIVKGPQTNGVGSPVTYTIDFSYDGGATIAFTVTGNTLTLDFV